MVFASITSVTATIIRNIPSARWGVNGSLKINIPTHTAVTGSIAPKTEVSVEPMLCTALINVILDITVGTIANNIRLMKEGISGIVCNPVFVDALRKKRSALTMNT